MWSHYADAHRGLCIEFDTEDNACKNLCAVNYARPRSIKVSDLIAWKIQRSTSAEEIIHDAFFFSKAPQWRYEMEWRDISPSIGTRSAPFRISGIYFGLRCDDAVKNIVVKLYAAADQSIKFYELYPRESSFGLERYQIDRDEVERSGLRSSALLDFKDVAVDQS